MNCVDGHQNISQFQYTQQDQKEKVSLRCYPGLFLDGLRKPKKDMSRL